MKLALLMAIGSIIGIFAMAICYCSKDEFADSDEREYGDESKS